MTQVAFEYPLLQLRSSMSDDQLVDGHFAGFVVRFELIPVGKNRLRHQPLLPQLLLYGKRLENLELFSIHRALQKVPVGLGPLWNADYLAHAKAVCVGDQIQRRHVSEQPIVGDVPPQETATGIGGGDRIEYDLVKGHGRWRGP